MKNYKKVHREHDDKVLTSITCDICKTEYPGTKWGRQSSYDILETKIEISEGKGYPEGTFGTIINFDICPECFNNKLIPFLVRSGATVKEEDLSGNW
jgi:hypothetical protein